MARSDRRRLAAVAGAAALGASLLACNAIIGLSDFEKIECTNFICPDDGGTDGPVVVRDGGDAGEAEPVTPGADPVAWARWKMPSWADAGVDPRPEYSVNGNEVTETGSTNLVWTKGDLGSATYDEAVKKCGALPGGGWRLPKRIELVTLLDFGRGSGPSAPSVFDTKELDYWTSSQLRTVSGLEAKYWVVDFRNPSEVQKLVTTKAANNSAVAMVRCVKGKP